MMGEEESETWIWSEAVKAERCVAMEDERWVKDEMRKEFRRRMTGGDDTACMVAIDGIGYHNDQSACMAVTARMMGR